MPQTRCSLLPYATAIRVRGRLSNDASTSPLHLTRYARRLEPARADLECGGASCAIAVARSPGRRRAGHSFHHIPRVPQHPDVVRLDVDYCFPDMLLFPLGQVSHQIQEPPSEFLPAAPGYNQAPHGASNTPLSVRQAPHSRRASCVARNDARRKGCVLTGEGRLTEAVRGADEGDRCGWARRQRDTSGMLISDGRTPQGPGVLSNVEAPAHC